MKDAFANPTDAGAIIHKHHPQVTAAVGKGETEAVAQLAQVPGHALGEIDPARIQATLDVVNGAFKLKSQVAATDIYAPGFVAK